MILEGVEGGGTFTGRLTTSDCVEEGESNRSSNITFSA